jgi:uncharacterized protein YndB with AHSA1/START domain
MKTDPLSFTFAALTGWRLLRDRARREARVRWGATGGWPSSTLTGLDDCPHVTATLTEVRDRTDTSVHVELPAGISEDRVRELSAMGVRDGWRQTVDRLTAELARTSTTA